MDKRLVSDARKLLDGFGSQDNSIPGTLGDMFEGLTENPLLKLMEGKDYIDYQLSYFVKLIGYDLVAVRISSNWWPSAFDESSYCIKYLRADAICKCDPDDPNDLGYRFHVFLSRYKGTPEEWKRLENTTATDLTVRFSRKQQEEGVSTQYFRPTWLTAYYGDEEIKLHGERIDFDKIEILARADERKRLWEESQRQHYWSSQELDALRRDAFNGD